MAAKSQKIGYLNTVLPIDIRTLVCTNLSVSFLYVFSNLLVTYLQPAPPDTTVYSIEALSQPETVPFAVRCILVGSESVSLMMLSCMLFFAFLSRDILDISFNVFVQVVIVLYSLWINLEQLWDVYTILFVSIRIVYIVYIVWVFLQIAVFSRKRFAWSFFKIHGANMETNHIHMIRQTVKIAYKTFIVLFFFRWVLDQVLEKSIALLTIDLCLYGCQVVTGLYIDVESYPLRLFMIFLSLGVAVFYIVQIALNRIFIQMSESQREFEGVFFFGVWVVIISLVTAVQLFFCLLLIVDMKSFGRNLQNKNHTKKRRIFLID
ncbi:hypothetical protein NEFER03_2059 [Nematocida sp. LUAm3]|nr:hypothetical protein NEFER03_2059 [Nematocida sp. LUAm3]KAI5176223.1 hypothetical protein NEFER02_2029 [Nematocida sp. LUAm2]KAI5179211.1 hypothetical protein NEFER01_2068 [Nematocida sp. LUAm1]